MNEIKKEWLIDRAEYMFAEIEDEIARLQAQIEKDAIAVNRMEDEFSASEEDFYIAAIDAGLDEKEAAMQRDDLYAAHINDQTLVNLFYRSQALLYIIRVRAAPALNSSLLTPNFLSLNSSLTIILLRIWCRQRCRLRCRIKYRAPCRWR